MIQNPAASSLQGPCHRRAWTGCPLPRTVRLLLAERKPAFHPASTGIWQAQQGLLPDVTIHMALSAERRVAAPCTVVEQPGPDGKSKVKPTSELIIDVQCWPPSFRR
jgi:hypothetical protein